MASISIVGESRIAHRRSPRGPSLRALGLVRVGEQSSRAPSARPGKEGKESMMIGVLMAVLFAALVWAICVALGLPAIVGVVAAILVLVAGIPSGGYGMGSRFGRY